ncbi:AzlC family ABC transporter permease [Coralliovum pocilloporae]|uniref:AzlC family ABC transporter permease n=1 Tax=Coralliovum pocilloporae TaxID=3066369 RepID=UPI003307413D
MTGQAGDADEPVTGSRWFLLGLSNIISVPAIILITAFAGFASLARESGFSLEQALVMTATVWALPAQVVLVGSMAADASLWATAFAVTLSSVRLLPMIVSLLPLVRTDTTPRWQLFLLSHFIAITAWVFAMARAPEVPRQGRLPFLMGFGCAIMSGSMLCIVLSYLLLERLPPVVSAALFFLTPVYFLTSLTAAAKAFADKLALAFGLVLGPVFFLWIPGLDLLWTGLVGGTAAYLIGRFRRASP